MTHRKRLRRARRLASLAALAWGVAGAACACGPQALGTARTIEIGGPATEIGLKTYPRTLKLDDGEFVLTFDDGPNPPTTDRALRALADECVKATFFLIGRNADAAPDTAKAEVAAGHTVGHHSYSHPGVTLRNLSEAAAKADIDRGIAADDRATIGAAGPQPTTPFFRFPGFADTGPLDDWLMTRGITIFGADLWASDWLPRTPDAELALLLGRMETARKGIILLHDTHLSTVQMLPALLREMKKRGWRIAHIVPGKGPTPLAPAPANWASETEKTLEHLWPKAPPGPGAIGTSGEPGPL